MSRNPPIHEEREEDTMPDQITLTALGLFTQSSQSFSTFSKRQKRWIVFLAVFAGWFSTLSSFIYFPAMTSLALHLHTNIENINLTIPSYLLCAAIALAIIGFYADNAGRRPAYLASLTIYLAAKVGLALQTSFVA